MIRTVITFRNKETKHTFTRDFMTMVHNSGTKYNITVYNHRTMEVEKFTVDLNKWDIAIM